MYFLNSTLTNKMRKKYQKKKLYNLVFLQDLLSGRSFLVDMLSLRLSFSTDYSNSTSSSLSDLAPHRQRFSFALLWAHSVHLRFGSRCFSWSFHLALVLVSILGSDFLRHHALLVDVTRVRVLDADSLDVLSAISSPAASDLFCAHLQQAPREIWKLLSDHPDVLYT